MSSATGVPRLEWLVRRSDIPPSSPTHPFNVRSASRADPTLPADSNLILETAQSEGNSQTPTIIIGVCCGALGLIIIALLFRCYRGVRRRWRREAARLGRRQQGIDTLASAADREEYGPLNRSLLQHLDLPGNKDGGVDNVVGQPKVWSDLHSRVDSLDGASTPANNLPSTGEPHLAIPMKKLAGTGSLMEIAELRSIGFASQVGTSKGRVSTTTSRDQDGCVICLDPFKSKSQTRRLPCKHIFHLDCIDEWLVRKMSVCPLCKFDCAAYCLNKAGPAYRQKMRQIRSHRIVVPEPDNTLGLV
ncbi:hypothetical protein IWQ60_003353 [Tieghemiomyces parasiticus]|uniref:RING-type domain-containing protein n=1 Tax=Tieghemiomyces parasiticus TaxID=78921 RepID=A0A9W8AGB3_9FUNG|nr:hypothetical protein IWQ60_003353 [Tieghemiomyces parasiticus]